MKLSHSLIPAVVLGLALTSSPAVAQGGAGGSSQGKIAASLQASLAKKTTAGPGAVQSSFFGGLSGQLTSGFGKKTSAKMMTSLRSQSLVSKDVTKLMNGGATKSQLKKWFGASRSQVGKVDKALDGAVDEKNRNGFFGMLMSIMSKDFGIDPTSDFASQCGSAKEEIDKDMFKKLCSGDVSTKTIEEAFGLKAKDDCKFMQEILNSLKSSPMTQHPMMSSLGMGKSGGSLDKSKFPKLTKGMAGFCGSKEGDAGGFACDFKLPPCPFFEGSFSDLLKGCKTGKDEEGDDEDPDDKTPKPDKPKAKPGKKKGKDADEQE
jgi:hypothetical protein